MTKYAIFFDIDGTIVPEDNGIIPESTREAVKLAKENGHYTFINTGRTFPAIDQYLKDLDFDGLICGCGTNIYFRGQELLKKELSNELSFQIARDLEKFNIDGILEGKRNIYFRRKPFHKAILRIQKQREEKRLFLASKKYWDDENIVFDKMALWYTENGDFEAFRKKYEEQFEMIHRGTNFYELVPKGYSKATGMAFLEDYLEVAHEDTIAIGDSTNDLSMLEYAEVSIAMGNSNPAILNKVTYVTDDIHKDGIYKGLQYFHII